jgi:hypothetical protein
MPVLNLVIQHSLTAILSGYIYLTLMQGTHWSPMPCPLLAPDSTPVPCMGTILVLELTTITGLVGILICTIRFEVEVSESI